MQEPYPGFDMFGYTWGDTAFQLALIVTVVLGVFAVKVLRRIWTGGK